MGNGFKFVIHIYDARYPATGVNGAFGCGMLAN